MRRKAQSNKEDFSLIKKITYQLFKNTMINMADLPEGRPLWLEA